MSGAEPCTGSNSDGNLRSGFRLADGARPMVPVQAGPRSDRMSPNRLVATTHVEAVGLQHETRRQDVDVLLVDGRRSGYSPRDRVGARRPTTAC